MSGQTGRKNDARGENILKSKDFLLFFKSAVCITARSFISGLYLTFPVSVIFLSNAYYTTFYPIMQYRTGPFRPPEPLVTEMLKRISSITIDIITVYRYNIIKAGEHYEHQ